MYDMFCLAGETGFSLLLLFSPKCLISADLADSRKVTAFVLCLAVPVEMSTNTNIRLHGERKRGVHMTMTHSVSGPVEAQAARSGIPSCLAANCQAVNYLFCVYFCRRSV